MAGSSPRLLGLLSLLQARRIWSGAELAIRLGVSDRTLRRDIESLRELGYGITPIRGPAGGYRLDAGAELPPLLFDDDQAVALAVALRTAAASGAVADEAAQRAFETVRRVLPSRLRHRVDGLAFSAVPVAERETAIAPEELLALTAAVRDRERIHCDHRPGGHERDAPPDRLRLEPHHIVFRRGRWYLVAWDRDGDRWRVLRADRLRLRPPNGPRFAPRALPGGDVHEFIAARFKGSDGENVWPCSGEAVLALPAARVMPFIGDGTVEALGEDRCRLRLGSWSWVALAAAFIRFDTPLAAVAPIELVAACALVSRRTAAVGAADPATQSGEGDLF